MWEEKGLAVEAELDDRVAIRADESLMELVWTNLLSNATICSLCTGVVGLALLFCATFTAITSKALTWLSILLAIPGIICCALAYPIYGRTYQRREREVESLLDAKREEICTICEKGHRLTHAELS